MSAIDEELGEFMESEGAKVHRPNSSSACIIYFLILFAVVWVLLLFGDWLESLFSTNILNFKEALVATIVSVLSGFVLFSIMNRYNRLGRDEYLAMIVRTEGSPAGGGGDGYNPAISDVDFYRYKPG